MAQVTNPEAIQVAAKWWADQLWGTTHDNGVPEHNALVGMIQARLPPVSEETIQNFRTKLEIAIAGMEWPVLFVDYQPDAILSEVGKSVGLDLEYRLPWKTHMCISNDLVKVGKGYAAPYETIYTRSD